MNAGDLKRFGLLAEFSEDDRDALWELLEDRCLPAGRRLFSEGSEADGLLLLVNGSVRVESGRGGESELFESGSAFGGLCLVSAGPREATGIAQTPCEFLILPRDRWHRLLEDHPRTACRLAQALLADLVGLVRRGLDKLCA